MDSVHRHSYVCHSVVSSRHNIDLHPYSKLEHYDQARKVFTEVHTKNIDWPEAIWEAWIAFEHMHGSVEEVDTCLDKIEKAEYQVTARRAKVGTFPRLA